jgi:hypothetical protein
VNTALLRHHTPRRHRLESLRRASLRHKMPPYQVTVQHQAARCPEEQNNQKAKTAGCYGDRFISGSNHQSEGQP